MNKRIVFVLLTLIVAASMMLSACGPAATEAPVVTEAPATEAPPKYQQLPNPLLLRSAPPNTPSKCCSSPPWTRTSS